MAHAIARTQAPLGAVTILRVVTGITSVLENIAEWRMRRRTRKLLNALTDFQLDDIGLSHKDIALI